jgi:hypothetical protein
VFPDEHVLQMLCVPVWVSAPHWLFAIQYFPRTIDAPRVLVLPTWGMFVAQVPAPHVPPEHVPAHSVPQAPQFCGSVLLSTHTPPHSVRFAGQTHAPDTQVCAPEQTLPHVPQLALFTAVSTQVVPHSVSPPLHVAFDTHCTSSTTKEYGAGTGTNPASAPAGPAA